MKTLLSAIVILSSTVAMSAATPISKDDTAVYPAQVTLGAVRITTPKCPINAMCAPNAVAQVTIKLAGCLDRVVSVSSNVTESKDGKAQLNISAIAVKNKKSATVKCFAPPMESREILIQGGTFAAPETVLNDLNAN